MHHHLRLRVMDPRSELLWLDWETTLDFKFRFSEIKFSCPPPYRVKLPPSDWFENLPDKSSDALLLAFRFSCFLFVGLHFPRHFDFGKSKKNQKSQQMLAGHDKNCSTCCLQKAAII